MERVLDQAVRQRARHRCEYCHVRDGTSDLRHVIDHIIARQHGGQTLITNLALCCGRCNQFKGPNIAGVDAETGKLERLFNPRVDKWDEHFRWEGAVLVGKSPIGQATVAVLAINLPLRVAARRALIEDGVLLD